MNSESNPLHAPAHWSWFDEKSWKGYCNTKIMQSPIDVVAGQTTKSDKTKGLSFKVNYSFVIVESKTRRFLVNVFAFAYRLRG